MNKKKLLIIALALVLVMTVLMPSAAFAKNNFQYQKTSYYTDFTGSGFVYVAGVGGVEQEWDTVKFYEEIVLGALSECSWEQLAGAEFWSTHDSVVKVANDGSAQGMMWGNFILKTEEGTLSGTFRGRITGNLGNMAMGDISQTYINDTGSWICTGGTDAFQGVKAWGNWSANLALDPDLETLAGPLLWSGKYSSPVKWDGKKQWKSVKQWKFKPQVKIGNPFNKGWKNSKKY